MANEIKEKYSASAALTITLASLASSTAGAGRQSTLVDNMTTRYRAILLFAKIKQGTSPTGNRGVNVSLIRKDASSPAVVDDGAGDSDAAFARLNAQVVMQLINKSSPATGDVLQGSVLIENPGPYWGVAVDHDTGVNLDSTGGNHAITWIGILPEVQ